MKIFEANQDRLKDPDRISGAGADCPVDSGPQREKTTLAITGK